MTKSMAGWEIFKTPAAEFRSLRIAVRPFRRVSGECATIKTRRRFFSAV
jgi:hypothetical protein